MTLPPEAQLLSLTGAEARDGGATLAFTVSTSGGVFELTCAAAELGHILAFFAGAAQQLGDSTGSPGRPTNDLVPIPATGLGFQAGATPDKTILVMNVSGFGLGFEVESSGLNDTVQRLIPILRTLSASGQTRQ